MSRWYTADLHFGHRNIIVYSGRPDTDVAAMNERIVTACNDWVGAHQTLYNLGDVALGKLDDSLTHVARIVATQHLIAGNHDRCWGGHRKQQRASNARQRYLDAGFATIADADEQHIAGRPVMLSHLPYRGDHDDERYAEQRPVDQGQWLICGHVHEKWLQRGRQINVGIDIWQRPVHEDEIAQLIAAGPADRDTVNDLGRDFVAVVPHGVLRS